MFFSLPTVVITYEVVQKNTFEVTRIIPPSSSE